MAKTKFQFFRSLDMPLLILTLLLAGCGLIVLYSASTVESFKNTGDTTFYILHQVKYGLLIGLLAMAILSQVDYHFWRKILPFLLIFSLASLLLVKFMGVSVKGAQRWLDVGAFQFQPAELAKLVVVFYLAAWLDRKKTHLNDFYFGVLPSIVIVGLFAACILWQPDLGTMLVLVAVMFTMLFVGGVNLRYLFWTLFSGIVLLLGFIKIEPYRARRLTAFLNPSLDLQGISYQVNQAQLAIGSGRLLGYGYGLSRAKYQYLPEAINDSVFAVMAEELGFIRVTVILLLFVLFILRGMKISLAAPDNFGKMTALGIVSWIGIQTIINIGAMLRLLPLTGIPLPFFSYGSTSLIITLAATGILLNISRQSNLAPSVHGK